VAEHQWMQRYDQSDQEVGRLQTDFKNLCNPERGRSAPRKGVSLQWVRFPPDNWVAPAGSSRSGRGGNEAVEASDAKGRSGGPASGQAATKVNFR
jgi:hypothetical protein